MSKTKLKTRVITDADREILRDAVATNERATAIVEDVLARVKELEQYVDGLGPPFMPQMG